MVRGTLQKRNRGKKGTISNERIWELGYNGEEPINPHTENIKVLEEYIERLEEQLKILTVMNNEAVSLIKDRNTPKAYVELVFTNKSFDIGRTAIVAVPCKCDYITTYVDLAKEKVCKELGLDKEEVIVCDYRLLGQDTMFIK